jgi:hypothetical protein
MRASYLGDRKKKHLTTQLYGQRNKSVVSWGFNEHILNKYIWPQIKRLLNQGKYLGDFLLVNDYTFEATNYLISRLNPTAITVAFIVENDTDKCRIQKWIATYFDGTDQLTIVYIYKNQSVQKIKELKMHDKFNLIISNPPYGSVGANVTKDILTEVKFDYYINLLPANDYKRNTEKDLFNYQSDMVPIINGFKGDATVTTHLALIHSTPVNSLTEAEFLRSQYIDEQLNKYFEVTDNRVNVLTNIYLPTRSEVYTYDNSVSAIFTKRDVNHKHLPYSKKVNSYKWNVEKSIDADYLIAHTAVDFNNTVSVEMIVFKTAVEKDNFTSFIYSTMGFKFVSKLCKAVNVDSRFALDRLFPKVDWTRAWTVEEILADYGYTEEEIAEVMTDLNAVDAKGKPKYKGMED